MARPEKIEKVESVKEVFDNARSVVLNDFTGLNVEKLSELRKLCREAGVEYRVVKNKLARRGLVGTPAEELDSQFEGPTALAIGRETENMAAKILADFAKEHEAPKFKAGIVEGKVIDATELLALAKLPSKEELLSTLLASIKSPGNGLVSVLQGTLRNLLYAVNAIIDKKKAEGETAEPPAAPAEEKPAESAGAAPATEKKPAAKKAAEEKPAESAEAAPATEKKPAAKKAAEKKPAESAEAAPATEKKPAAKKTAEKKPAEDKSDESGDEAAKD